jgi:hypothetical protein
MPSQAYRGGGAAAESGASVRSGENTGVREKERLRGRRDATGYRTPSLASGGRANLAFLDIVANVILAEVVVERDFGALEHQE